jgi:predicted double-glycine peptidase
MRSALHKNRPANYESAYDGGPGVRSATRVGRVGAPPRVSPEVSWPGQQAWNEDRWDDSLTTSSGRLRAATAARPLARELHTFEARVREERARGERFHEERVGEERVREAVPDFSTELDSLITMATAERRVVLPKLPASRPPKRRLRKTTVNAARAVVLLLAAYYALSGLLVISGRSALPLADWRAAAGVIGVGGSPSFPVAAVDGQVVNRVQPFTQMRRADLYDTQQQFQAWGGSACSAAVLGEILTSYGVQGATIGHMIDELGSDISLQYGLETYDGFARVAAKHGFRADIYVNRHLTYAQMLYLTDTLGIPVIVNVRATSGYYHYLSGGHFLVMTGGDAQNVKLVDSSLYYIKSLSLSTFNGMFRNRTVVLVPKDYQYTLPS